MNIREYIQNWFASWRRTRRGTKTVRRMFSAAALGMAVLLGAATISSTQNSFVTLATKTKTVEAGSLFEVQVMANAATAVNAVEVLVNFPSEHVEVFSVDRGQSVLTIWTEDPVVKKTSVSLRGGTFQRGFIGQHELATINFRAKKTGQYKMTLSDERFIAGDGSGTVVDLTTHPNAILSLFTFDETTPEEDIALAIKANMVTDIDGDGEVTLKDISAFMGAWHNKTSLLDFNGDGRMTFRDFSIILAQYFLQ